MEHTKGIINFIKYHNAVAIGVSLIFVLMTGALASESVRNAVLGEEIIKTAGIDNSQILSVNLDSFDFSFHIKDVSEDEENYYVDYAFYTLAIAENQWQKVLRERRLKVLKEDLGEEDLGLYVAEEIGEVADYELSYLKKVQELEREKGLQRAMASIEYTGLKGLLLDTKEKVLPGYEPVIKEPEKSQILGVYEPKIEEPEQPEPEPEPEPKLESSFQDSGSLIEGLEQSIVQQIAEHLVNETPLPRDNILPNTVLDSHPKESTIETTAVFEFHATKEGCQFTCQIDTEMWKGCTSPTTYKDLKIGYFHTFKVRAIDQRNQEDPAPAEFIWKIEKPESEPKEILFNEEISSNPEVPTTGTTTQSGE